ncbi:MAG: protease inhibitor I42 family protein [Spirochaetaceae bacterium]|jgi:predicted secreted protein|nr:protease inhibitor I42 family protein [Spirochaetaceae bacterium]
MKKLFVLSLFICSCAELYTAPEQEQEVVIELAGNRTTGYSWTYTMEPDGIVQEISSEYRSISGTENNAGAGGFFIFVFKTVKPGVTELRFSYARPWENETAPAKTAVYVVTVDGSGKIKAVLK